MIYKLKTGFTLALCFGLLCADAQKSKKNNKTSVSFNNLSLSQGQKLQVENTVKSVSSMEMMGQSMEITADVVMTRQLEVKEKKDKSFLLGSTITRINMNSSFMGQAMSYDSDKKEDSANQMGQLMKDQLNVQKEVELDNEGRVIAVKKDSTKSAAGEGNPMMSVMESMGAGQDESNGISDAFQVLPSSIKVNDTWSDSAIVEGSKTYRTYTVKEINGNDITLALTGTQAVNKTMENQGMEATVSLESKISGDLLVDKSTGIVKQKTLTVDGTGTTEAMGQSIPMTTKVTTTSVVKSL